MGVSRPPSGNRIAKSDFALSSIPAHLRRAHNCKSTGVRTHVDVRTSVHVRNCSFARPQPHDRNCKNFEKLKNYLAHLRLRHNCKMFWFGRPCEINILQFLYYITVYIYTYMCVRTHTHTYTCVSCTMYVCTYIYVCVLSLSLLH